MSQSTLGRLLTDCQSSFDWVLIECLSRPGSSVNQVLAEYLDKTWVQTTEKIIVHQLLAWLSHKLLVFSTYLYQLIQIQVVAVICYDFRGQANHKDIHSVGIYTGPSCKNELEWNPNSSNIPSHLHHGYLEIKLSGPQYVTPLPAYSSISGMSFTLVNPNSVFWCLAETLNGLLLTTLTERLRRRRRQHGWVVRMLNLKSVGPWFKSCSDHQLMLFSVALSSTSRLCL